MIQPKYISDENWAIMMRSDYVYHRFIFGFAEIGEVCTMNNIQYVFRGTFNRKKDATALATINPKYKVESYLFGKFKTGWSVIETL